MAFILFCRFSLDCDLGLFNTFLLPESADSTTRPTAGKTAALGLVFSMREEAAREADDVFVKSMSGDPDGAGARKTAGGPDGAGAPWRADVPWKTGFGQERTSADETRGEFAVTAMSGACTDGVVAVVVVIVVVVAVVAAAAASPLPALKRRTGRS